MLGFKKMRFPADVILMALVQTCRSSEMSGFAQHA
jgi:hypothetical protein